ncbi:MAG: hypothetical protein ABI988_05060 [Nitrospirota bacterium]
MGWVVGLVLQLVSGGDELTQGILNMSLKEALQEYVVCRKDFEDHQNEFDAAMTIEEPSLRRNALENVRLRALAKCGVRP